MIDAKQESYATAPSALMVPGKFTPAPMLIYCWGWHSNSTLHFCAPIPVFSPSFTKGTTGSIALYPHWLCVVLNKAFCSSQAHCIEFWISYRWWTDRPLSGRLIGWSWGFKYCVHIQRWGKTHFLSWKMILSHPHMHKWYCFYVLLMTTAILTWSNCASSPLWRDRDRGFSCKRVREIHRFRISVLLTLQFVLA